MNKSKKWYVGFADVVQIVFIILKLTGLVDWTWLQVMVPYGIVIGLAMLTIMFEDTQ